MSVSFLLNLPGFEVVDVVKTERQVDIYALSNRQQAACHECGAVSYRVHSSYSRHPQDLPLQTHSVRLHLTVKRFFCDENACPKRTFAESIESIAVRYARRTGGVTQWLEWLGRALGGSAAARLGHLLGVHVSRYTILRTLRTLSCHLTSAPRIIGIDDWAWRKHTTYGTIVCDLETRQVIDVLVDCETDTVSQWLTEHPTIHTVCRDRSQAFAKAIGTGAPQAQQVADRWHLLKDVREALQEVLASHRTCLTLRSASSDEQLPVEISSSPPGFRERSRTASRAKRLALYEQVVALDQQGRSQVAIAIETGLSTGTISRWLAAGQFPERKTVGSKALQSFLPYIHQRWEEGCHNASQLWREISQQGYERSYEAVRQYVNRLKQGFTLAIEADTPVRRYKPAEAAYLLTAPVSTLTVEQQADRQQIRQAHPDIEAAYQLTKQFRLMAHQLDPQPFHDWMVIALSSELASFVRLASGFHRDRDAVVAALTLPYSNGVVEGHINRLKYLKRQMYGRANLDLLRIRLFHPI